MNKPCWLKYFAPGILSVPAPGQSTQTSRLYGISSRGSGWRVIANVVSSVPVGAARSELSFKPRKALMSEDFPDPEAPQTPKWIFSGSNWILVFADWYSSSVGQVSGWIPNLVQNLSSCQNFCVVYAATRLRSSYFAFASFTSASSLATCWRWCWMSDCLFSASCIIFLASASRCAASSTRFWASATSVSAFSFAERASLCISWYFSISALVWLHGFGVLPEFPIVVREDVDNLKNNDSDESIKSGNR